MSNGELNANLLLYGTRWVCVLTKQKAEQTMCGTTTFGWPATAGLLRLTWSFSHDLPLDLLPRDMTLYQRTRDLKMCNFVGMFLVREIFSQPKKKVAQVGQPNSPPFSVRRKSVWISSSHEAFLCWNDLSTEACHSCIHSKSWLCQLECPPGRIPTT